MASNEAVSAVPSVPADHHNSAGQMPGPRPLPANALRFRPPAGTASRTTLPVAWTESREPEAESLVATAEAAVSATESTLPPLDWSLAALQRRAAPAGDPGPMTALARTGPDDAAPTVPGTGPPHTELPPTDGVPDAPAPDKVFSNKYLPPKADRMVSK